MKIGSSVVDKITSAEELQKLLVGTGLDVEKPLIIKPNWISANYGEYTDSSVLELLFKAIPGKKYIVESYTFWRSDKYTNRNCEKREDYFSSKEATLEEGKKHWDHFKKQDEWFLEYTGIGDLFENYDVEYINVTDEYWSGKCVDSEKVKKIVEGEYEPVARKEFYGFVPEKLFEMQGSQFLSFAHAKAYSGWVVTLSTKNLFGLLPAPSRWPLYHGEDNSELAQNIIDVNKIYRSLFDCWFAVEGVSTVLTEYHKPEHEVKEEWGVAVGGKNSAEVDMIMAKLLGKDLGEATVDPIKASAEVFGEVDNQVIEEVPEELAVK